MADEVYDGAIGIDLGTSKEIQSINHYRDSKASADPLLAYSCVAVYEGAGVEISKFYRGQKELGHNTDMLSAKSPTSKEVSRHRHSFPSPPKSG